MRHLILRAHMDTYIHIGAYQFQTAVQEQFLVDITLSSFVKNQFTFAN
jgi:dihydroneopterin aldolase